MSVFDLASEPADCATPTAASSASGCCLSRRLVQSGVRFIEVASNLNFVNGTGWDTHNEGQLKQHVLIESWTRACRR